MGDIARNRPVQDKDNVGGLRAAYFIKLDESVGTGLGTLAMSTNSDEITALINGGAATGETLTIYKYDLQGTSTLVETETNSRDNGTVMYEQVLTLSLKKKSVNDNDDLYALATSRWHILVEDKNGNLNLVGKDYGSEKGGDINSGAALGDLSGYSYTFTAMEKRPANFVQEGAIWTTGNLGSLTAANYFSDITIGTVAGTASRS